MCRLNASRRRACARIHYSPGGLPSSYRYPLLPCTRIFENSQKKSKAGADQDLFSKMAGAAGKKSGIPEKKPRFRVPSPQDLGIPIGQIRSPSYAIAHTRTFQSIHALPELSCPLPVSELRLVAQRARSSRDCPCPDGEQRCRGGGHPCP
jgi:hypothetical protein